MSPHSGAVRAEGKGHANMTRKRLTLLAPLVAVGLVVAACGEDPGGGGETEEFARSATLYTGGAQWGAYTDFNPNNSGEVTFLRGFIYETLFEFDPNTAELSPWLAESGEWTSDNEYQVVLREGITWHDGEALTADDVVFTFDLRTEDGVEFGELADWLESVEAVDERTVLFTFSDARKGQWDNVLYSRQIVPQHTWEAKVAEIGQVDGADIVVGSGPYTYHSHDDTRLRYARYDDWWGTEALGLEMQAQWVVDFANESNETAVNQLVQNELDLSNFFLPNITELPGFGDTITTYLSQAPYMLSANTAALIPNNASGATADPALRRALAFAINTQDIVDTAYGGIVQAADPTGLLPLWQEQGMVDDAVVAEHGFSYDPAQAEQILDDAGYTLDGDVRVTPDGEPLELTLNVQQGWTDWELAAEIIAESAQAVGINVTVEPTDPAELDVLRDEGNYDLVIDNQDGIDNHPYTKYYYLYRLPVEEVQPHRDNPQRHENEQAWELTQELATLSIGDPATQARFDEILSELQEIALTDMPVIPMWFNGAWSQVNNTTWTNWPSDAPETPDTWPITWAGYAQMGGIRTLAEIQPAGG
jgi:peptide/nickel transport system substrate-binding protein